MVERSYMNDNQRPSFWQDESGVGVVEVILILVVLIALVIIFRRELTSLVNNIFSSINSKAHTIYG